LIGAGHVVASQLSAAYVEVVEERDQHLMPALHAAVAPCVQHTVELDWGQSVVSALASVAGFLLHAEQRVGE
jgi:hypothetical protein